MRRRSTLSDISNTWMGILGPAECIDFLRQNIGNPCFVLRTLFRLIEVSGGEDANEPRDPECGIIFSVGGCNVLIDGEQFVIS